MRRVLVPLIAVPLGLLAGPAAVQAAPTPTVVCQPGSAFRTAVKPRTCVYVPRAADPDVAANRLTTRSVRWRDWGRRVAEGSGLVAAGTGSRERATLRLYGLISCGDGRSYTRGRVVYRDAAVQRRLDPKPFKIQACAG
ncbi:hypothetical protein [Patulibacter sp.]|uniref:hypothetical protein n=1 Tax=Patulibacter sp. TaxID=1912859 RepID=UPI00271AACEE|nr:hypothetical protein [Patulibacter sp.]MDO9407307.1 hypothetical protein [Patulibacter sp.]